MTERPRFNRILLKLGGEALRGEGAFGIDERILGRIAGELGEVVSLGVKVGVVVGGGNFIRGLAFAGAGGNRVVGDHMGMLGTVMNALALSETLARRGVTSDVFSAVPVPTMCETFTQARAGAAFEAGRVVIFAGGTGNPFFTTDTAGALRAAEMGCDALLKATKVDGVFSADPERDEHAVRYERLTYDEVFVKGLRVMDQAAVSLARDNQFPVIVFSILRPGELVAVLKGDGRSTNISAA